MIDPYEFAGHIDAFDERQTARMFNKFERDFVSPYRERKQKRVGRQLISVGMAFAIGLGMVASQADGKDLLIGALSAGFVALLFLYGSKGRR